MRWWTDVEEVALGLLYVALLAATYAFLSEVLG